VKCATLVVLFLVVSPAFAAEPSKEPADLVKARLAYEAKVKAAVDPIRADYLKTLDRMMRDFGAAGDLDSAQAVQQEIKTVASVAKAKPDGIVGKWAWALGLVVEFGQSGSASSTNGDSGKWVCLDPRIRKYEVSWKSGSIDWMAVSADGMAASCHNNNNKKLKSFAVRRIKEDKP
jgi:hypothetical protein